jgi:hypothetical protein
MDSEGGEMMANLRKRTLVITQSNWKFCEQFMKSSGHFDSVDDAANYLLNSLALNTPLNLQKDASKVQKDAPSIPDEPVLSPVESPGNASIDDEPHWFETADFDDV